MKTLILSLWVSSLACADIHILMPGNLSYNVVYRDGDRVIQVACLKQAEAPSRDCPKSETGTRQKTVDEYMENLAKLALLPARYRTLAAAETLGLAILNLEKVKSENPPETEEIAAKTEAQLSLLREYQRRLVVLRNEFLSFLEEGNDKVLALELHPAQSQLALYATITADNVHIKGESIKKWFEKGALSALPLVEEPTR